LLLLFFASLSLCDLCNGLELILDCTGMKDGRKDRKEAKIAKGNSKRTRFVSPEARIRWHPEPQNGSGSRKGDKEMISFAATALLFNSEQRIHFCRRHYFR
jgi:hypothetical protein